MQKLRFFNIFLYGKYDFSDILSFVKDIVCRFGFFYWKNLINCGFNLAAFHLRPNVFNKLRDFGKTSPIEMKNKIKTERAVILLESTDDSVEKIIESLGFSSSAYFRKTVKRYTGMTPMKIRKNAKHI